MMAFQIQILQYLEQMRNDTLTLLLTTITIMAEQLFVVMVIGSLYWCVDKQKMRRLGWYIMTSVVVNNTIKMMIKMPRPYQLGVVSPIRAETATGASFPSGHTQMATSFWGGSMLLLKNKAIYILGSIMILLVGLSRLYLGVHWPMDVFGGILFGVTTILLADKLLDEKSQFNQWHIIGVSVILLLTLIFDVPADLYKGAASLWGLVAGCYIETHYIKFVEQTTLKNQCLKVLLALGGLILIYFGMKLLLPSHKVCHIIRYSLVILWATCGAPYCFVKLKLASKAA